MNILQPLNSPQTAQTRLQDATAPDAVASVTDAATPATTDPQTTQTDTTTVSSRAESLATLNSEFNIMSADFRLTQGFVSRMAQLELISSSEAEKLGAGLPAAGTDGTEPPTVGEMKSFLTDYIEQLKNTEEAPEGLLTILEDAKTVLDSLDSGSSSGVDIAGTAAALKEFIESEAGLATDAETDTYLRYLNNMLAVADSLSPANRTSANVNAYIKVMQGL